MENFTPVASLLGGILIGLSSSAMLLFNGKVAGISGIVGGIIRPTRNDTAWRIAFVAGLLTGGLLLRLVSPRLLEIEVSRSVVFIILAGLLVGFGSRLGNGCTSGHGVCGMSRGSVRSIIATLIFIAIGALTVYFVNHLLGGKL